MNVSITKAEFEAIIFCKEQVVSQVEATSDEDFVNEANEAFDKIYSFEKKYYKAVQKHNNLLDAKQAVKKLHPELHGRMADRLVKLTAKQLNENLK
jgi:SPX domain protein involved in polyphosphate accumulation